MKKSVIMIVLSVLVLALPGCGARLPDKIDVPSIDLPGVDTPQLDLPEIKLPEIDLPEIDLSKIDLPSLGLGELVGNVKNKYKYEHAGKYAAGDAQFSEPVRDIEINWTSGSVTVKCGGSVTSVKETASDKLEEDMQVHTWLEGDTLHIEFCGEGEHSFGKTCKDLCVTVPEGAVLSELEIKSVSAGIELDGISAYEIDCKTVSSDVTISASGVDDISSDTVSGNTTIFLPEGNGFRLELKTVSGDLITELPCRINGDEYICGDGSTEIDFESVSGNVEIRTAK